VRVIDDGGQQCGIMPTADALHMARERGLDLVEVSPNDKPPVCRIMDFGKHKYDQKKKQKQHHAQEQALKEIRLRPKTDDHDREIKMSRAQKFLKSGHKVQFTMLFRGRERSHRELAFDMFNVIVESFNETAKVERPAHMDGRRMTMVLAPLKK